MGEAAVFAPETRLELIDGAIVEMAPIGSVHAGTVMMLNRLLGRMVGDGAIVSVQGPLVIGDRSVPQPDLALLKPRNDNYMRSHPGPADTLLVTEVADTTLAFDIGTKVPLYALAGIPEAWVIDLPDRAIRVFRDPSPTGYRNSSTASAGESVSASLLPAVALSVASLFPIQT